MKTQLETMFDLFVMSNKYISEFHVSFKQNNNKSLLLFMIKLIIKIINNHNRKYKMELIFKELEFPKNNTSNRLTLLNERYNEKIKEYQAVDKFIKYTPSEILNEFAEDYLKEKAEISNKKFNLNKDNIIKIFKKAGFIAKDDICSICVGKWSFNVHIKTEILNLDYDVIYFRTITEFSTDSSPFINLNDIDRINFYYKLFWDMFVFEISKVKDNSNEKRISIT